MSYCRYRNHTGSALRLADFTAGRELHPALKMGSFYHAADRLSRKENYVIIENHSVGTVDSVDACGSTTLGN